MNSPPPIHATLVARPGASGWRGLLVRGPSGAGKSTLALALAGRGWRLVADDRVTVWVSGGRLWGRAPKTLKGLLEVRGVGVVSVPTRNCAEISAVIDAVNSAETIERLPETGAATLCGVPIPCLQLHATGPFAADKAMVFCDALRL